MEKPSFDKRRGEAPCFSTEAVEAETLAAAGNLLFFHKTAPYDYFHYVLLFSF
ncbi:hypothetical protein [uncultured Oscillibacter sp.]|uniref:hypothetical protein n=1 Tax=uncultured Oscillibacter sp. TaxID=876091 RepID=UPI00261235D3|nr:hypothetical protein [uncultured Oscillibacter sp.]